jgi:CubicO group peptidase (beta-lactamase class C family)
MTPSDTASLPRTARELQAGIDSGLHLGGQIYVSLGGESVADLAFGEVRPGEPMRTDHLPLWLSMTKPVAAVAVAQLWEAGQLALDDTVARHLPEFAVRGKERITLRHLLTHTAGLRLLDSGWPKLGWDEIVARVCAMRPEPRWEPGKKAGYHRSSTWFLLGELVRRLSGLSFERYVRLRIFEPLGMDDCWIGMPAERFAEYGERLAPTFDVTTSPPADFGWSDEPHLTRCSPGENGCGPVRQLARLYECLLAGGSLDGARLLSPQTVEALTARHRVGMTDKTFRRPLDWGLGFVVNSRYLSRDPSRPGSDEPVPYGYGPHASVRAYGHSGYRTTAAFADPEHGLTVAFALNGAPDDDVHRLRADRLCAALYDDLAISGKSE